MRAFFFLCCTVVFAFTPNNLVSQHSTVKIPADELLTVDEVFNLIMEQTDYKFFYEVGIFKDFPKLQVRKGRIRTNELLKQSLAKGALNIKVTKNNTILISENPQNAIIEKEPNKELQDNISGTITDMNNQPLPGASIVEKSTTNGTQSDFDGNFSLTVKDENAVLIVSYIGFATKEVAVNGRSTIKITLEESAAGLDEVVVIGYGTQRNADITGSISKIKTDNLFERPIQRVDQALVGQVAGVRVKQTTAIPGKGFSINIRGTGSISANNQPLYVIDGFPIESSSQSSSGNFDSGSPMDNISPNDILSIEVLKDASASAIYGSRASNGVVIITTKSGVEGKAQINFKSSSGLASVSRKIDMMNAEEWIDRATDIQNSRYLSEGLGRSINDNAAVREANIGFFDVSQIPDQRWSEPGYGTLMPLDWQDKLFQTGFVQSYALSASGGNQNVNYYTSGEYQNTEGTAIGLGYEQFSVRANVEIHASEKFNIGLNVNPSFSTTNDPGIEGKEGLAHHVTTLAPIGEESAGYYANSFNNGTYIYTASVNSPIARAENVKGVTKRIRTLTTMYAEYEIINGLKFRSTLNLDLMDNQIERFRPASVSGSLESRTSEPGVDASGEFLGFRSQNFVNEDYLTYNTTINNKHNLSVVGGFSYSVYNRLNWEMTSLGGFNNDVVQTLNNAVNINQSSNTTKTKNSLVSFFSRAQYNFLDKYLLTASVRRDGSSRFGKNNMWGTFPSASIGWRITEESFMPELPGLSDLKLRASWGISGNNGFEDFADVAVLGVSNYTYDGVVGSGQGLIPSNIANPNFGWETSEMVDIGMDLSLFENRIQIVVDYFVKNNRDLLLSIPVPATTGFGTAVTNIGRVQNRGWELDVTGRVISKDDFSVDVSANLSHLANEVKELGPGNAPILGGSFDLNHNILKVGLPMYSINVVRQDGILTQADIDAGAAMLNTQEEGDPKYFDANGDGRISADDRIILGHPIPDYTYGITTKIRYKGFDLAALLQGQWGGDLYSTFGRSVDRTGQGFEDNILGVWRNRWRSPSDPGAGLKGKAYSTFGRIKNTDWMYSNDYWRIRNITLGYDIGRHLNKNLIQGMRMYVSMENFFGNDRYYGGYNPEAVNTRGEDYGAYPLPKSVVFGFNVTL